MFDKSQDFVFTRCGVRYAAGTVFGSVPALLTNMSWFTLSSTKTCVRHHFYRERLCKRGPFDTTFMNLLSSPTSTWNLQPQAGSVPEDAVANGRGGSAAVVAASSRIRTSRGNSRNSSLPSGSVSSRTSSSSVEAVALAAVVVVRSASGNAKGRG